MPKIFKMRKQRSLLLSFFITLLLVVFFTSFPPHDEAIAQDSLEKIKIVAVVPKNFPPQYSVNSNGEPMGFAIDVMNHVAEHANIEVTYLVKETWAEVQEALEDGTADLIPNHGITTERQKDFVFTSPIETFEISIFVRSSDKNGNQNIEDFSGRRVAVIETNVGKRLVVDYPEIEGVIFQNVDDAIFELLSGGVDALVYPKPVVENVIRKIGVEDHLKITGKPLLEVKRGMSTRKEDVLLINRLDKALEEFIRDGHYQETYVEWYGSPTLFWSNRNIAILIIVTLLIIAFALGFWRYVSVVILNKKLISADLKRKKATTSLQKNQERLVLSEERYKRLFEEANDSIFIMDGKTFIECNSKTLSIYGCDKKSDIVGHTPIEFSPIKQPDGQSSGDKAKKYIKAAFDGKRQDFYWQHSKKNGDLFDAEVSLKRFIVDGKKYLQATVRDITKRKTAEHKLKESEDKFKTVVSNAQAIIFMLDKKGKFLLSEGKGLSLLGLKSGQVVGASAFEIYKDYPSVLKGIKEALMGRLYEGIILVQGVYFDIFFSPDFDENGKVGGVIGMAIDVTNQEEAKIKLQEIDKMKTEFMSTASHQLRSPLGSMRWNLETILSSPELKKQLELESRIKDVYESNLRVIDLINDLLNVSRIEQGRVQSKLKKVNVVSAINDITKELKSEINHKKLKFIFVKPSREVIIEIDEQMLREAIQNLVSNAIKYNKIGGRILLVLEKKSGKIKIDIANTGLIIPKKDRDRVFDKFFRSEQAVKTETDGTGLGLFVTKSYVERCGGKISFESPGKFGVESIGENKFEGTIFSVELPKKSKLKKDVNEKK